MRNGRAEKLQDLQGYPPRLMSLERAAAYIGFGPTKFKELVNDSKMPQALDIDGSPRWDRIELDAAVEDLKDRRRDPVKRSRDNLERRLQEQERQE